MTKEEILAEAKRRYPVGTIVLSIFGRVQAITIIDNVFIWQTDGHYINNLTAKAKEKIDTDDNYFSIYEQKKGWAKIINKNTSIKCYELW
jgi:hypothetical protein